MRLRLSTIFGVAVVVAALGPSGAGTASAQRTCTWGGTPLAPTGQNRNYQGISNTPSTHPIRFHATGPLAGDCKGTFVFDGVMDTGATCGYITFHGRARGIRGVARFAGVAVGGLGPARLYDRDGDVVGSENAQFLADRNVVRDCNSSQGVMRNAFSSGIALWRGEHA
jgi:hypothetical protein